MLNRNAGIVVAFVVLITISGVVAADRAELEEKLRQEVAVDLNDVTIEAALREIGGEAGLRIDLSADAIWKLPDGADTRLSVKLEGQLGKSLEQMLNSFFMRYAVGGEALTIYPRPELRHVIGRPTTGELKLLRNIYGNAMWGSTSAEASEAFVRKMFNAMAQEPVNIFPPDDIRAIGAIFHQMSGRSAPSSTSAHDPNSSRGTPVTIASLLEAKEHTSGKTWYIEGPEFPRQVSEIRIVTREEFWKARLDQIIDIAFEHERGEAIIRELARRADMDLTIPYPLTGQLNRDVTLHVYNVKLRDALEKALSTLGIAWKWNLSEGTIELLGSTRPPQRTVRAATDRPKAEDAATGGYVGKISIPMEGGKYFIEFMLRESDLTDELRQLRQAKIEDILEELSKAAKEQ